LTERVGESSLRTVGNECEPASEKILRGGRFFVVVMSVGSVILGLTSAHAGSVWGVSEEDQAILPDARHAASASTFGYVDTGLDPDDRPIDRTSCCQQDPDIRSSTRRVWEGKAGMHWLSVNFRAFEPLSGYWSVTVGLDSRGGRFVDHRMHFGDDGLGQTSCFLGSGKRLGIYHAPRFGDRASCRVPLRWVAPSKRIRWKLFSPKGFEGTGVRIDEYAPDRGWYSSQ
jgi:hypothetical protein